MNGKIFVMFTSLWLYTVNASDPSIYPKGFSDELICHFDYIDCQKENTEPPMSLPVIF